MTYNKQSLKKGNIALQEEPEFEGVYGHYRITKADQIEVQKYRIAVLTCGISFCIGLGQWIFLGPTWAWVWLIPMAIGLGLALKWIHIYLRPLHKALQILWLLGCLGIAFLALTQGPEKMLTSLVNHRIWILAIGPLFASMTGLGFKEFFCFRRPEAVGLTLLVPISLLGHLSGIISTTSVMILLISAAFLLLILAIRKFGMDAASDIGDKSVFTYLENKEIAGTL